MRDSARLDKFYDTLKEYHKKYLPDWRFGQLIINFISDCGDPFYYEEDELIEKFKEYMTRMGDIYNPELHNFRLD